MSSYDVDLMYTDGTDAMHVHDVVERSKWRRPYRVMETFKRPLFRTRP